MIYNIIVYIIIMTTNACSSVGSEWSTCLRFENYNYKVK